MYKVVVSLSDIRNNVENLHTHILPERFIKWLQRNQPQLDVTILSTINNNSQTEIKFDVSFLNDLYQEFLKRESESKNYKIIELSFPQINNTIFTFNIHNDMYDYLNRHNPSISLSNFYGFDASIKWDGFNVKEIANRGDIILYDTFDSDNVIC